jgi:hypothetical protein
MNRRITPKEAIASDAHMAAQRNVFGEGHIVTDIAVMPHMRCRHQKTAVADPGYAAACRGADIDRHHFASFSVRRVGQRPVTVIVSEREIDFLLAHHYELSRKDADSIGRVVAQFLSDSALFTR